MNHTAITHRHCEAPLGAVAISFPKYKSYKGSGVEWLGDIPVGWGILPGMRCFYESKENNQGMIEDTVLSLSYGNIVIKPKEKLVGLVPESFETYQIVNQGDIIIRCTDLQNDQTSLRTGLANNRGIITSAYLNLRPFEHYDSRFIHYYLHALDLTKTLYRLGSGLRQNLSFNDFKRLPVPDITKPQQQAIVSFLDDKTAQIDEAISIKKKQIELLKEHKQIIIQNTVTKGLNPNVPMKDSGVEWIGYVPEGWEVKKLKYVAEVNKESLKENTDKSLIFDYVDIGNVSFENGIEEVTSYTFSDAPSRARRIAKQGDTIVSTVRTYLKAIDFVTENKSNYIYSTGFAIITPKNFIYPEFMVKFISSDAFTNQVDTTAKGVSYPAITSVELSDLPHYGTVLGIG